MTKSKRFIKAKVVIALAFTVLVGTVGLSSGVLAAPTQPQGTVTIVEKYPDSGVTKTFEWNGNWYAADYGAWIELVESTDKGETWHPYLVDYETMKFLYSQLAMELCTYEEFVERIAEYKEIVGETTDEYWNETMGRYEEIAEHVKNGTLPDTYYPMMKGHHFSFKVAPNTRGINGANLEEMGPPSSYSLDQFYSRMQMTLEYCLEDELITQSEADQIWKDFLAEFNLVD